MLVRPYVFTFYPVTGHTQTAPRPEDVTVSTPTLAIKDLAAAIKQYSQLQKVS